MQKENLNKTEKIFLVKKTLSSQIHDTPALLFRDFLEMFWMTLSMLVFNGIDG